MGIVRKMGRCGFRDRSWAKASRIAVISILSRLCGLFAKGWVFLVWLVVVVNRVGFAKVAEKGGQLSAHDGVGLWLRRFGAMNVGVRRVRSPFLEGLSCSCSRVVIMASIQDSLGRRPAAVTARTTLYSKRYEISSIVSRPDPAHVRVRWSKVNLPTRSDGFQSKEREPMLRERREDGGRREAKASRIERSTKSRTSSYNDSERRTVCSPSNILTA
ncbi:hypothetical protein BDZ89DRAFT_691408 [Hymenopellis radicata]|nr:hypothetical protein BDZ89DRAFT_691408 [Hymenopellis radicata]